METELDVNLPKEMLREQLCCLGRIFARHKVADDVVWEVVKAFDIIYQRTRQRADKSSQLGAITPEIDRMRPHPGLTYLLEKIGD